jgi:hypothetical protein
MIRQDNMALDDDLNGNKEAKSFGELIHDM